MQRRAAQPGGVLTTRYRAEASEIIKAAPEQVWRLLSSPAVLSLRRGVSFAFEVPWSPPGSAQLYFDMLAGIRCRVLKVCEEEPGRTISLSERLGPSVRSLTTLSMGPAKRGVSVRIAIDTAGSRATERDVKRRIDAIRVWLTAIRLVVEGRIQWPAAEMPATVHKQCTALPTLENAQTASADVLINAPVDVVWEVVWAPQTSCLLGSEPPVYADTVPGTPAQAIGEMQYSIYQRDESLLGRCHAVTDISLGRAAMVQAISPPHEQMHHVLSPEGSGCRFTLTGRYGGEALDQAAHNAWAARLQGMVGEYKTMIEQPDPHS